MQVERYGYKWTKKKSGYYQSTRNFPDGTRHWLHREVYVREIGEIPPNYSIHHLDENKDNNAPSNLEAISNEAHSTEHMKSPARRELSSTLLKKNNARLQKLALAARMGQYSNTVSKDKECAYCGKPFTLKLTDKNTTRYCSYICGQRGSQKSRKASYAPLEGNKVCPTCGGNFTPVTGNQYCCSEVCRKAQTELARKQKFVMRQCQQCGECFETIRSSKKKYCSVTCRQQKRAKTCN